MKSFIYFFVTVCLVSEFFACKKNPEVGPDDTSAIDPFMPTPATLDYQSFFSIRDFFAELPATFPESGKYRVSGIDIKSVTDENVVLSARFVYNLASGRLVYKLYKDYRNSVRTVITPLLYQHNYVLDEQNRLISEKSDKIGWGVDEQSPVDITYEYEGNLLKKIVKKSTGYANYGTMGLSLIITYRYENNRRVEATILDYYYGSALSNLEYPWDSTRRKFVYSNNNQAIIEQDSSWYVPCFPKIPCINRFMNVDSTTRKFDAKGNLISIHTTRLSGLYPKGITTYQNEYNGPDGLLSRIVNVEAGFAYHFRYLEK